MLTTCRAAAATPLDYFALETPCVAFDTRSADAPALGNGFLRQVAMVGRCGIPASARALALNLTVMNPTTGGFLVAYPADQSLPATSALNFNAATVRSNGTIVPLAQNGSGTLALVAGFASGNKSTADLVIEVRGYFSGDTAAIAGTSIGPLRFETLTGCRLADTRVHGGALSGGPNGTETRTFGARGRCGIPDDAAGLWTNLAAVSPTQIGKLTVHGAGQSSPFLTMQLSSSVPVIANGILTTVAGAAGSDLAVTYQGGGQVDVVLDTNAYLTDHGGDPFTPITPCRAVDTRSSPLGPLAGLATRTFGLRPACGAIPDYATAVAANVTVVGPTGPGFLTVFPAGGVRPSTSAINFSAGEPALGNAGIYAIPVAAASSAELSVFAGMPVAGSATHVIVDIYGYFGSPVESNAGDAGDEDDALPLQERGVPPNRMYQVDDIESVNLLNGNLNLTLPIGPRYPVGGQLDYGFRLDYNAKLFDQKLVTVSGHDLLRASVPPSNAGIGWSFSLGGTLSGPPPGEQDHWKYTSSDGSVHTFHSTLNFYEGSVPAVSEPGVFYTRDSTYLRLKTGPGNAQMQLEMPDGMVQLYGYVGWPSPSGANELHWRLVEIHDRFGNRVAIDYSQQAQWIVTDSTSSRQQVVYFVADPQFDALVSQVQITSFGQLFPLYTFHYTNETVDPGDQDTDPNNPPTLTVPKLDQIDLPDSSKFKTTIYAGTGGQDFTGGMIRTLTLPYGGSIEWNYQTYRIPVGGCLFKDHLAASPGVRERIFRTASDTVVGRWLYEPSLSTPVNPIFTHPCQIDEHTFRNPRAAPEYAIRKVTTPLKDYFLAYFSVLPDPHSSFVTWPGSFDVLDHGLPFSRHLTAANGTEFISRETYDCYPDGTHCDLDRREYVRYERDREYRFGNAQFDPDVQARLVAARTVYVRDDHYKETVYDQFDGLGHHRSRTERGDFQQNDHDRKTFTDFNSGAGTYALDANHMAPANHSFHRPAATAPWVLGTFGEKWSNAGTSTVRERFCFNGNTGFLDRRRIQYNPENPTNKDILIAYKPDDEGNVKREDYYGADDGTAPTDTCGTIPDNPEASFSIDYKYTSGVLRRKQYLGGGLDFLSVDRDIDPASGLPLRSRDAAGLVTEYEHDLMGRLRWVKPMGSAAGVPAIAQRGPWTEISYFLPGSCNDSTSTAAGLVGCARILSRQRVAGSQQGTVLAQAETYFDGLGRQLLSRVRLPGSGTNTPWAETISQYDGMNQRTFVSQPGSSSQGTSYLKYDPYGRPTETQAADGHSVHYSYGGERSLTRTVTIGQLNGAGAIVENDATTTEIYDFLGRLVSVKTPAPIGPQPAPGFCNLLSCPILANYTYDVGNRLTAVTVSALEGTQSRAFGYDGLGFLRWQDQPELETPINRTHDREILAYSPLGHIKQVIDGSGDRTLAYDRAGRLLSIERTADHAPLLRFTYDRLGGSLQGASNGKPVRASRFNYRDAFTLEVRQDLSYSGREGAASQRTMSLLTGGTPHERFTQSFSYNDLGNPATISYPLCDFDACPPAPSVPGGSVNLSYDQGFLTAVSGYASALKYHPNGSLFRVEMTNGQAWQQDLDPSFLPRPRSICLKSTTDSSSCGSSGLGPYQYDGVGNVVKIGSEAYSYDLVSRLVWAEHDAGSAGARDRQIYAYDGFGNLTAISSNLTAFSRNTPTSPSTNRLTGAVAYDKAGNLTQWNGHAYDYDELGMMSRSRNADLGYTYFLYDAGGERVLSLTPAVVGSHERLDRWTLRDLDGKVLRVFEATNYLWRWSEDYIYRGSTLLASESPAPAGTARFFVDHLGTPRQIFDGNGGRAHHYFPYGEEYSTGDAEVMKFTGHERDLGDPAGAGDDLDFMHARFYNPMLGRFLGPDPAASHRPLRSPLEWNLYLYANASPLRFADPDGRAVAPCREDAGTAAYPHGCDFTAVAKDTSGYRRLAAAPGAIYLLGEAGTLGSVTALGTGLGEAFFGSGGTALERFEHGMATTLLIFGFPAEGHVAEFVKAVVSVAVTAIEEKEPGYEIKVSEDGKTVEVTTPGGEYSFTKEEFDQALEERRAKEKPTETQPGEPALQEKKNQPQ